MDVKRKYNKLVSELRKAESKLEFYSPVNKELLIGKAVLRQVDDEVQVCVLIDEDLGNHALRAETLRAAADWLDDLNA